MMIEYDGGAYDLIDYENILKLAMKTGNIDELVKHSKKMKGVSEVFPPSALSIDVEFTVISWLEFLNRNGSEWAREQLIIKYKLAKDYDMISWTIECFIEGLEKRNEYVSPSLYYLVGYYKYIQFDDSNLTSLTERYEKYEGEILSAGHWYKKAVDAGFDYNEIDEGQWCIDAYNRYFKSEEKKEKINFKPLLVIGIIALVIIIVWNVLS